MRKEWNLYLWLNIGMIHILAYYYSKTTENYKLWSKQKFLRISSSLQWCVFETSTIITAVFWVLYLHVLSWEVEILHHNFRCFWYLNSVFVSTSYAIEMPLAYWLHPQVVSSPEITLSNNIDILCDMTTFITYQLWERHFFSKNVYVLW